MLDKNYLKEKKIISQITPPILNNTMYFRAKESNPIRHGSFHDEQGGVTSIVLRICARNHNSYVQFVTH